MIFQSDLLWYSALEAALADMRKNKFLLDDAYSCLLTDPLMKQMYGQKEIDNFKAFLDKKIHIFTEHRPPDTAKFPAFVIQIGGGTEDAGKDALGDGYGREDVDPATLGGVFQTPQYVVEPRTPIEYDDLTGQVTFGPDVDLTKSNVFEDQIVYDEVNKKGYVIQLVIDSSNLVLEQGINPPPNLTGMTIRQRSNVVAHTRRAIWAYETHTVTSMATNATEVLYLYTLMIYMLGRYKKQLWEARNFQISTISYGPIYRASPESDPNIVYARDIQVKGRVEHSWIESTAPLIQGVNMELQIADMETAPAFEAEVAAQGWSGEGDEDL